MYSAADESGIKLNDIHFNEKSLQNDSGISKKKADP